LGWRYSIKRENAPIPKLLATQCASDAVNVVTAFAPWMLRHELSYEESVASIVLSKTAELVAQVLLLVIAITLASTTQAIGVSFLTAMDYLLVIEVVCVAGFVWVQLGGVLGTAGRFLEKLGIDSGMRHAAQLDEALWEFYRHQCPRFLLAIGMHLVGWVLDVAEALLVLWSLALPASITMALVLEALGSAVLFVTFFVPVSLGPLEGANALAFAAVGFGASAGLAFSLVRRARQAIWFGLGLMSLAAVQPGRSRSLEQERIVPLAAD
jgi:hypothetical protein